MVKAIFFLLKVSALVALAVWLSDQPGSVTFDWIDVQGEEIRVKMPVGIFFVAALIVMVFALFVYRMMRYVVDFPKTWSRYRQEINRDKGYKALTLGLSAVAAGDSKIAQYQAYRAEKLLANDNGLPLLLKAQAARLNGHEHEAHESFVKMLDNNDAAFMGVRGLLHSALEQGRDEDALTIAETALKNHPKQSWILRTAYDLQIKSRNFEAALLTLKRLEKAKGVDHQQAKSDQVAILLFQADNDMDTGHPREALRKTEKAYKLDPTFIPTVLKLARVYLHKGKKKKAATLIEKAWRVNTHPDLVPLWEASISGRNANDPIVRLKWYERLLALDPRSSEGQMAVARAAMDNGLWGEARNYLTMAESIRPSSRLYKLFAELEERSGKDAETIRHWLEMAADTPANKTWVCAQTGRVYEAWSAYALPHESFNTIIWDLPQNHGSQNTEEMFEQHKQPAYILETPKI